MKIHLVGGAVRDMLLGRPVTDRDYLVTGASPEEFLASRPGAFMAGKSFPVAIFKGSEYAWPRAGGVMEDLHLRDLTINALAMRTCENGPPHLLAHPLALHDLENTILRPASNTSMRDDPVRVYRAARFAAQLPDFTAHPSLIGQMRELSGSAALAGLSPERVAAETRKALGAPKPGRFLALLNETGCLGPWFKEYEGADAIAAGPPEYHDKSVLGHVIEIMDALAGDELAVWMGLCHDLGKTLTPRESLPRHLGHDVAGAAPAKALAKRLRLPSRHIEAGILAAKTHMKAGRYGELRPGTKTDLLTALHAKDLTERLFRLVAADHGRDYLEISRRDLEIVLSVRLDEKDRNLGAASGEKLRSLRAQALAQAPSLNPAQEPVQDHDGNHAARFTQGTAE